MLHFFSIKIVAYIVAICIGIILILNFILNLNRAKNDTVNNILNSWSNGQFFFISFFWGVLGGHFFLGSEKALFGTNWWLPVVILVIITGILFFIGKKQPKSFKIPAKFQVILLVAGLLYGHFIWSQRHEEQVFKTKSYCENATL